VISREYMNVKQWDLRTTKAVHSTEVSDAQTQNLQQLQKNDALDDEFFLSLSQDGKHMVTGGYDRSAHLIDA